MRTPFVIVLAFAAGAVGIVTGQVVRQQAGPESLPDSPETLLHPGDPFPSTELVDESGATLGSRDLFAAGPCVVLFIDPDCPPCAGTSARWQRMIDDGAIGADRVFGVTFRPVSETEEYRNDNRLVFAIYQDPGAVFLKEYQVHRFPLEVTVDATGTIREVGRELSPPVGD
jgi:peroxiredoxin